MIKLKKPPRVIG